MKQQEIKEHMSLKEYREQFKQDNLMPKQKRDKPKQEMNYDTRNFSDFSKSSIL